MKSYKHEVIMCIVNSGFSEAVMDAARELGLVGDGADTAGPGK